jgi:hypothetical protein
MSAYVPNRTCQCPRCRARGLMGPGILITLGVLFLLDQTWVVRFHESFPVLLIVIGVLLYLGRSASIEGHVDVRGIGPAPAPPPPAPVNHSRGPEVNP